jgi:hypothetical protein
MSTFKHLVAIAALSLAAVSFNATAANAYKVKAQISQDGELIASPEVVVTEQSPAVIKMDKVGGQNLVLTATYLSQGKVSVTSAISSAGETARPTVMVGPGSPATVKTGKLELTFTAVRSNS